MSNLTLFDAWLDDRGPAALVLTEALVPVEGPDGVFFPATYAAAEDSRKFGGGYNIDQLPEEKDGRRRNVCLVDSVGSQANRIEPQFSRPPYRGLVPQVRIKAGERVIDLLEAGHRAGDAIARCSGLQKELREAFQALQRGNALPLAKIAPTSLVFGVWDSRDTQTKVPRVIASTIRAYDVRTLTRSAQYNPATDYVKAGLLAEPADRKAEDKYAERGFIHVPASGTHGGVIAEGGVRRQATLQLPALRLLSAGTPDETLCLRRYILGIALTAFTMPPVNYLRQGCNLVPDPEKPRELVQVAADGRRTPFTRSHEEVLAFATAAAKAFGLDPDRKKEVDREVDFQPELAQADVSAETGKKAGKGKKDDKKAKST